MKRCCECWSHLRYGLWLPVSLRGPFRQNSAQLLLSQLRLLPTQSPHTGSSVDIYIFTWADHWDRVRNDTMQHQYNSQGNLTTEISHTRRDTWQQARGRNIFSSCRLNLNESCLRLDAGDRFEWDSVVSVSWGMLMSVRNAQLADTNKYIFHSSRKQWNIKGECKIYRMFSCWSDVCLKASSRIIAKCRRNNLVNV